MTVRHPRSGLAFFKHLPQPSDDPNSMKINLLPVLGLLMVALPLNAMIQNKISIKGISAYVTGFNDAQSDKNPDATTARFTLQDNPSKKCWEFRVWNLQANSLDLSSGLDVTLGTDIELEFQKYPAGDPQGVRWIYIQGADLRDFKYSDMNDTIAMKIRPIAPSRTMGYPTTHTAALGVNFYYSGTASAPPTYSPPVALGTVFLDDLQMPQHPSSSLLWGRAVRIDGIDNEPVRLDYIFGSTYADRWNLNLNDFRGYMDGQPSAPGFSASLPAKPSYSLDMGRAGETFVHIVSTAVKFSPHDFQFGVFRPAPMFTGIQREPSGARVSWVPDTSRKYQLQYFSSLAGTVHILATNLSGSSYLDTTIGAAPFRFYRLREE